MTGKDLFVIIYTVTWAIIETIFFFACWFTKCIPTDEVVLICNVAFLGVTSIIVFVPPVREWVNKHIIEKL